MTEVPSSLIEAVRYFADLKICNDYMRGIKWPDGQIFCNKCGSVNVGEITTRSMLQCREVFRFNARKVDDAARFASVMGRVRDRRVTWRQLTGQDGCGFMGLQ